MIVTPSPRLLLALAALLSTLPAAAQDSEKHLLRYRYQKGTVGHFSVSQNAEVNVNVGERSMDSTMAIEMFMEFRVADVANGVAVMKTKINRIKVKMANPMGGDIEFDTVDEDSVPAMFDSMLDTLGQTVEVSLDDRGRSKGIKVPEVMEQMASTGIDLEQMFSRFIVPLPEEPVAIGEVWKTDMSHSIGQAGKLAMDVDNTLLSVQGNDVTVAMKMKIDVDSGPELPGKVEVEEATSKITLDLGTGLPKDMDMNMKMNMEMAQGGMTMDMKMKIAMAIKPIPAPAVEKNEKK